MHLGYPPPPHPTKEFYMTIVFDFYRDDCNTQEELETMVMENVVGVNKAQ